MYNVEVNAEKCIGCGLCEKDCPDHVIKVKDKKAVVTRENCLDCGHCFAVCPERAINMPGYNCDECEDAVYMEEFDCDRLLTAMKSRRTVRHFKDKPVEQEKIDRILEAGRCCQTARNSQSVHFTILGSRQNAIENECVKMFRNGIAVGSKFAKSLSGHNIGANYFFKGAPLVIVVSGVGDMNRGLATSYMELIAESQGLGVLISGFTEICLNLNPAIRSMANIPFTHKIYSVMVIGYPDVKYLRTVPRKKLKVNVL